MEPGDKVLIPCPKRKRNIRFEGKQNEKLVLRAEVLEASEFSITVRFLDYGAVQEYNPAHTEIYFPDQEFFDDKTYPMFAIRYMIKCFLKVNKFETIISFSLSNTQFYKSRISISPI